MSERSPGERAGRFARDWASALAGPAGPAGTARPAGSVLTPADLADLLGALAADVLALAPGHPFQPDRAAKIGAALVDASLVHPEVLGRSLTVIARYLDPDPGPDTSAGAGPAAGVLEAITAGYVRALRDRTLADAQRGADEARRRACPIGPASWTAWPPRWPPRPAGSAWPTWTWTASPRSTTRSATTSGTNCWSRWPGGCRTGSSPCTAWSPGWAVTSSACWSRTPVAWTRWWPWPATCSAGSS